MLRWGLATPGPGRSLPERGESVVRSWMVILLAAVSGTAFGQLYEHKILLEVTDPGFWQGTGYLNDLGDALYHVRSGYSYFLYLNSEDYGARFPGAVYPTPAGLNDRGDVLWEATVGGRRRAMLNDTAISDSVGIPWDSAYAKLLNEAGQVAWQGCVDWQGEPCGSYNGVYVDQTNYNEEYAYGVDQACALALNDVGQLLWIHRRLDNRQALFIDGEEVTNDTVAGHGYDGVDLNNSGNFLWKGGPAIYDHYHVFLNLTDLTMLYLGEDLESQASDLNDRNQVLWGYSRKTSGSSVGHVMLDGQDISVPVVGEAGSSAGPAVNDRGDVLWRCMADPGVWHTDLYVNGFNLSGDALGDIEYGYAEGYDINEAGQVLWNVNIGDTYRYYLSTPIPEPSSAALVLGALIALTAANRRWSRRS
jgi:hypothetical protein